MNNRCSCGAWSALDHTNCPKCGKLLAGVQGPELGLVGDVAERITIRGTAEDGLPGERGVGEIAGAVELREYVDREITEALVQRWSEANKDDPLLRHYYYGKACALVALRGWLDDTDSQRSDLSNV